MTERNQSPGSVPEPDVTASELAVTTPETGSSAVAVYSSYVGINQAARLTHKGKQQIYRDVAAGKISWHIAEDGRKLLPVSDLDRLYGLKAPESDPVPTVPGVTDQAQNRVLPPKQAPVTGAKGGLTGTTSAQGGSEALSTAVEIARLQERLSAKEDALQSAQAQIRDLRETRDRLLDQNNRLTLLLTAPAVDTTVGENASEPSSAAGLTAGGHDDTDRAQKTVPWWKRIFK